MRKIAHIINPFDAPKESTLFFAQPVTFNTMEVARQSAKGSVDVEIFYTKYPDETVSVPESFRAAADLDKSIIDIIPQATRKLPLLKEILDRLYQASDAEYFIYTNTDIALMPGFYLTVNALIEDGHDAFVINRRTIPEGFLRVQDLSLLFSQAGTAHPGHDCFVFKREDYPSYVLYDACIGEPPIGKVLLCNLINSAQRFKEFTDLHLTFHIGKDAGWNYGRHKALWLHNYRELERIVHYYEEIKESSLHPLTRKMLANQRLFFIGKQPFLKKIINRVSSKFFSRLIFDD